MDIDLSGMSATELLRLHARTLAALRALDVVRTANNPVADYAELLVCKAFRLVAQPNSNKGFDALDPASGERYEVKARRASADSKPTRFSPLRDLDGHHFDFLVAVLLDEDFAVARAIKVPWESVRAIAKYNHHVNGHFVFARASLWDAEGAEDVTQRLLEEQAFG